MKNLSYYPSLVELLGKPQDDLDFTRFINQLDEKPLVDDGELVCFYHFPISGFEIVALTNLRGIGKHIASVVFFVDTPDVRAGSINAYVGQFLSGVTPDDSIKDVKRKMNSEPTDWFAETVPRLRYDYPHHTLHFHFREPDGGRMSLASLHLEQNNRHYCRHPE